MDTTGEGFGWVRPSGAGDDPTAALPRGDALHSPSILLGAPGQTGLPPLPPWYVAQATRYLLFGGPPPDPPFGAAPAQAPARPPDASDLLALLRYLTGNEDPQPRAAPRDRFDAQPSPQLRRKIPGTDIPDEGRPEDAIVTKLGRTRLDRGANPIRGWTGSWNSPPFLRTLPRFGSSRLPCQ
jgi:hypothetical protein